MRDARILVVLKQITTTGENDMIALSATDLAIRIAKEAGTLQVRECEGRFGPYWAIDDDQGLIEVHLTEADAQARIA